MSVVTRREIIAAAAASSLVDASKSAPPRAGSSAPAGDQILTTLWRCFLESDSSLAAAWTAVERASVSNDTELAESLAVWADVTGHKHDRIVQQIASQPASSWQGVTVKLLTWRRSANLSAIDLPDAEVALAFSAYRDALRLSSGARGLPDDAAIVRLALRDPNSAGL